MFNRASGPTSCSAALLLLMFSMILSQSLSMSMPAATIAQCSKFPIISGPDTQSYTIQCATGNVPAGSVSEVIIQWGAGVTNTTSITGRNLKVQVSGHPFDNPTGQDQIALFGYLTQGSTYIPTCITNALLAVADNQTVQVGMTYPAKQKPPMKPGRQGVFKCKGVYKPLQVAQTTQPVNKLITSYVPSTKGLLGTPTGLRLQVGCKAGASGGACSAIITLTTNFKGLILDDQNAQADAMSFQMQQDNSHITCAVVSWLDDLNILGRGQVPTNIDVCQAPSVAGTPGINAPNKPWDNTTTFRAVRAARYASAFHGCLPGQDYSVTLTNAQGVAQTFAGTRQWDGDNGVGSWGGPPDLNFPNYRNPACLSCFKDGINWSDDLKPKGYQLDGFFQFKDAAMVFTDYYMSGSNADPLQKATVILFRATATALTSTTWLSNLLQCGLINIGGSTQPFGSPANTEAGTVCTGWQTPVGDLVAQGLLGEVLRRVNNSAPADRTVYVIGHSRGGALATVFASYLIHKQQTGELAPSDGLPTDQIKLYTFGSPRVGDATFAAYLENNMYERYRVVNRFDAVPTLPSKTDGFVHFRPSVWFRDPGGDASKATQGCVLVNPEDLTPQEQQCYISCNQALLCNYGAGVDSATPGNDPANCTAFSDLDNLQASFKTVQPGAVTLIDHMSYMGVDVNNGGCSSDVAMIHALQYQPSLRLCNAIHP